MRPTLRWRAEVAGHLSPGRMGMLMRRRMQRGWRRGRRDGLVRLRSGLGRVGVLRAGGRDRRLVGVSEGKGEGMRRKDAYLGDPCLRV